MNNVTIVPVTGHSPAKVARFDSLEAIGLAARAAGKASHWGNGGQWSDYTTFDQAIDLALTAARKDDPRRVERCEEMLERLSAQGLFVAKDRLQWRRDFHGHVTNVNAYLAGDPQCWHRMHRPRTDKAPLRVVVDTTSSGGIDSNVLAIRGIALTAMVRALRMTRATTLEVVAALGPGGHYASAIIDPDDLVACAWALGSTGYSRALVYCLLGSYGADGSWPYRLMPPSSEVVVVAREALSLTPDDVYVPAAYLDDSRAIERDPLGWLNKQLQTDASIAGREHVPLEALDNGL